MFPLARYGKQADLHFLSDVLVPHASCPSLTQKSPLENGGMICSAKAVG
jgi:hypothetical protein